MEIHLERNEEVERMPESILSGEPRFHSLSLPFDPKPTQTYRFCHLHPLHIHVLNTYVPITIVFVNMFLCFESTADG